MRRRVTLDARLRRPPCCLHPIPTRSPCLQALSYNHLPWWQQLPAHASLWLGKRRLFKKIKKRRADKAAGKA